MPVTSLFADLVPFEIQSSAYLLAAYSSGCPPGSVFLCVVDPGVDGGRAGAAVRADGRWYVGPDEGLFAILTRRARRVECWQLPHPVTASPVSTHGMCLPRWRRAWRATALSVPVQWRRRAPGRDRGELQRVDYIDRYGNAVAGTRAAMVAGVATLRINGHAVPRARTFTDAEPGAASGTRIPAGWWSSPSTGAGRTGRSASRWVRRSNCPEPRL